MAILDRQTLPASADLLAILDADTGNQLFSGARPLKATVLEDAQMMVHPREDGSTQIDHKIDLPISIQISVVMEPDNYAGIYAELRDAKIEGRQLTVQTKTYTHPNMFIKSIPREEDPRYADTITMVITLIEQIIPGSPGGQVTLLPAAVTNAQDADTVGRGQVSPTPSNAAQVEQVTESVNALNLVEQAVEFLGDPVGTVLSIPLEALSSQDLSFVTGGQRVSMCLRQAGGILSGDISLNGQPILAGHRIVPGAPLIPYSHLSLAQGLAGNFIFATQDGEYPQSDQLGSTQRLFFYTGGNDA